MEFGLIETWEIIISKRKFLRSTLLTLIFLVSLCMFSPSALSLSLSLSLSLFLSLSFSLSLSWKLQLNWPPSQHQHQFGGNNPQTTSGTSLICVKNSAGKLLKTDSCMIVSVKLSNIYYYKLNLMLFTLSSTDLWSHNYRHFVYLNPAWLLFFSCFVNVPPPPPPKKNCYLTLLQSFRLFMP